MVGVCACLWCVCMVCVCVWYVCVYGMCVCVLCVRVYGGVILQHLSKFESPLYYTYARRVTPLLT
jgi:hypothetical protein